jgi:ATP-binding cassette subfamily B protein
MSLEPLLLFIEYGASLMRPVLDIAESLRRIKLAKAPWQGSLRSWLKPRVELLGRQKGGPEKEIRFESLWFSYRGEDWILKDISFSIPKGGTTAIVGASGSGKSTAVACSGFMKPQKGRLSLDGRTWRA